MNSDTQLILEKLNKIETEIEKINDKITSIEKKIDGVSDGTDKMNNHINFVESMYEIFKVPMSELLTYYYGKSEPKLLT